MLVATTQTVWLFVGNGIAAVILIALVLFTYGFETWPSESTCSRLLEHGDTLQEWIAALQGAREVVIDCNIRSGSHQALLVPIHKIETHMNVVRQCWIDAKAKHSLLESSLRETLEDLVYVHEKFDTISVFPDNLDVILEAKPAFDARHDMRVLMKPTKSMFRKFTQ